MLNSLKVLITGANGFVGKSLTPLMRNKDYEVIPIGFGKCGDCVVATPDLTDFQTALTCVEIHRPSVIIHLAGLKDVFLCEKDKTLSHRMNVILTENITEICARLACKMIFISSDYVFDGENGPFTEASIPRPGTQYGSDKLRAEHYIQKNMKDYAIVRTSGIFGMKEDFVSAVIKHLRADIPYPAYHNLINTPTFVGEFAEMLHLILHNNLAGIFHCTGREAMSRFDFAGRIARHFSLNESLIRSTPLDFSADVRPRSLRIDSSRTYQRLNFIPSHMDHILSQHKHIWMQHQ